MIWKGECYRLFTFFGGWLNACHMLWITIILKSSFKKIFLMNCHIVLLFSFIFILKKLKFKCSQVFSITCFPSLHSRGKRPKIYEVRKICIFYFPLIINWKFWKNHDVRCEYMSRLTSIYSCRYWWVEVWTWTWSVYFVLSHYWNFWYLRIYGKTAQQSNYQIHSAELKR